MKLILVLSIIAYGYADKLDRAYLPPANAASSGGSPGSLIAPNVQPKDFGKGFPVSDQPGFNDFRKPITSQNGLSLNVENRPAAASFDSTVRSSGVENSAVPSYGNGHGTSTRISASSGSNNPAPSAIPQFSSNRFGDSNENLPSAGQSASNTYNQGIGPGAQGINGITQVYNQERPQAAADRNAETLKYINENNGESYSYSYETSNGISAEESGVAINGVMAQGGYAYTGDDGKAYSVSYTADQNGYQPQGEHLPTPHPIPEEILKSIEENAKAAAAGIQEGAYRPEEYESEDSQQQYNFGSGSSYQSQPGQEQSQGPASNPAKNNQYQAANQGIKEQTRFIDQSGQNGPVNQQYNKNSVSSQGFERQNPEEIKQGNQGFIQGSSQSYRPRPAQSQAQSVSGQLNRQLSNHGSTIQNAGQFSQGQEHGYQYNQPQKPFTPQSSVNQYRPQASSQRQNTFASLPSAGSVFERSQDSLKPSFGNRPSSDLYKSQQSQSRIGLNQQSASANRPLSESGSNRPQNQVSFSQQNQVNQNNQPFSFQEHQPAGQGYQYQPKQPSQGFNKPSLINDLGSHNEGISNKPSFYSNNNQKQAPQSSSYESSNPQFQQVQKRPSYASSSVPSQNSQIFKKIQNSASVNNQAEQSPQFSQNANKPSFNYNQSPNQISQYQQSVNQPSFGNRQPGQVSNIPSMGQGFGFNNFGPKPSVSSRPVQAPYQYNKPSQSFTTQPPNFLPLDSQSSKGKSGQKNQDRSEEFEGPRQPPSFNSQEGYKY